MGVPTTHEKNATGATRLRLMLFNQKPLKVCFIHIPKTGGLNFRSEGSIHQLIAKRHHYQVLGHKLIPKKQRRETDYVFCCVRHPLERLVSLYHYCKQGFRMLYQKGKQTEEQLEHTLIQDFAANRTFEEFVELLPEWRRLCQKDETFNYLYRYHFESQFRMINHDGKLIVDFMIRNETYDEDTKKMLLDLGIPYEEKLPRINATDWNRENVLEYYNEKTETLARELFKDDFAHLGYD